VRSEDVLAQTPAIGAADKVDPALHAGVQLGERNLSCTPETHSARADRQRVPPLCDGAIASLSRADSRVGGIVRRLVYLTRQACALELIEAGAGLFHRGIVGAVLFSAVGVIFISWPV